MNLGVGQVKFMDKLVDRTILLEIPSCDVCHRDASPGHARLATARARRDDNGHVLQNLLAVVQRLTDLEKRLRQLEQPPKP